MASLNNYQGVSWADAPDQSTPVNALNLNHMDDQIEALSSKVGNGSLGTYTDISAAVSGLAAGQTNGSVTKVGTASVGSGVKPIYLNSGSPAASTSNVGSGVKPVYMSSGSIVESGNTVGSGVKPIYMNAGTMTASDSSVGSGVKPIYMNAGTMTASSSNVGSAAKPIYMNAGTLQALTTNVGSSKRPAYLENGEIKACSATVGSTDRPVYMENGEIKACKNFGLPVFLEKEMSVTIPANGTKSFSTSTWRESTTVNGSPVSFSVISASGYPGSLHFEGEIRNNTLNAIGYNNGSQGITVSVKVQYMGIEYDIY